MLKNLEGGKLTNSCFDSTPSYSRPVSLGNVTFPWRTHIRKTFYHSILNLKTRKPNWSKTQTTTLVKVLSTIQSFVRSWLLEPAGKCQLETCPSEKCRVAHFSPPSKHLRRLCSEQRSFLANEKIAPILKNKFRQKTKKKFFFHERNFVLFWSSESFHLCCEWDNYCPRYFKEMPENFLNGGLSLILMWDKNNAEPQKYRLMINSSSSIFLWQVLCVGCGVPSRQEP